MLFIPFIVSGQSLNDAKKMYQEGNYKDAKVIFEEAYAANPNNAEVNYLMGVAYFDEKDIAKARPYLEFASQKRVTNSYIYLGELYSFLYLFEDAEKEFVKYEKANKRNKEALETLETKREYSERLQSMMRRTEDVQIIDSIVVPKSEFLSVYKLSTAAGTLQAVNEFFKEQAPNNNVLFMNERKDKIYYSHDDPSRGKKLYTMEKLLDNFGNEKPMSETVNQEGEQSYPFVLSDGITLYFASTGHESLGGYDLYVTRYNLNTNTYLNPNHLNMPFNSPFNDYMMVIDDEKGVGWFASDRFQPEDSVCIYTFIPSTRVVLIEDESDDDAYISSRARISSIKDTWNEGKDYSDLVQEARREVVEQSTAKFDFIFVINDNTTYYSLSDFKNGVARGLFSQALDLQQKNNQIKEELDNQREQFANGSDNATMRNSILSLENNFNKLSHEVESLMFRARNEEIRNGL